MWLYLGPHALIRKRCVYEHWERPGSEVTSLSLRRSTQEMWLVAEHTEHNSLGLGLLEDGLSLSNPDSSRLFKLQKLLCIAVGNQTFQIICNNVLLKSELISHFTYWTAIPKYFSQQPCWIFVEINIYTKNQTYHVIQLYSQNLSVTATTAPLWRPVLWTPSYLHRHTETGQMFNQCQILHLINN